MTDQTNVDEQKFGRESVEQSLNYEKMTMAIPDEPPPEDIDSKDILSERYKGVSAREAANILMNGEPQEASPEPAVQNEPVERRYNRQSGSHAGERMPENQTVQLDRASRDLTGAREADQAAAENALDMELREAIDNLRSGADQQQGEQPQPQPQQQPEQQPAQPQPALEGDDAIFQHPKVIEVLANYSGQMNTAFQQAQQVMAQEITANATAAAAALFAQWPELNGLSPQEVNGALVALDRANPQRALEIRNHINAVRELTGKAQTAQQQQIQAQVQQYRQQFDYVSQLADNAYDSWITQQEPDAGRRQEIRTTALQILKESGLSDQEISYHWSSSPILRSFAGQQILADAARYRMSRQGIRDKVQRPIPIVQRPGSSGERASDAEYRQHSLETKLNKSHSAKDAANLLIARRSGRR